VTLHRFFLPRERFDAGRVTFPPDVSRQLDRVLRLRSGDRVTALDGSGSEFTVRLDATGSMATGVVEERRENDAEPRLRLVLYQALLKGQKLEWVLQKGTEIGVSRFVPVATERSLPASVTPSRIRRYNDIVREAAEQSRRGKLPPIEQTSDLESAVRRSAIEGLIVFLWEEERTTRLSDIALTQVGAGVSLFVGPEGGFTEEEVALARGAGATICTLGKRVLRAETAAIVGASLLLSHCGDLG
jgi:16S rRNA (uracil1498-N3)-methyltransferase